MNARQSLHPAAGQSSAGRRTEDPDGSTSLLEARLLDWIRDRQRSLLRRMVGLVARPGIVSLAGGLPDHRLFPAKEYGRAVTEVLADSPRALQYAPPYEPLLEQIVELMARRGVSCSSDQIFLTTGAQQGLDTCARVFLDSGRALIAEEWVYTGVLQAAAAARSQVVPTPVDLDRGLAPEALRAGIDDARERGLEPGFAYVISDGHNPLGTSIAAERRQRLAAVAASEGVPLVEDDPYGFLSYDGDFAPPLKSVAPSEVVYLGSFSKILAPGLRLGWMVVPAALPERLAVTKEASDLECSGLTQRAVSRLLSWDLLPGHLETLRETYRRRRDALLGALDETLPSGCSVSRPSGGMFVWVELPEELDSLLLLRRAVEEEGVAFVPGHAFSAAGRPSSSSIRLSFATLDPAEIEDAVRRLGRVLHRRPAVAGARADGGGTESASSSFL